MHEIAATYDGKTIAVITHGGVLDVVYRNARALAWDAPREHLMLNASINRVHVRTGPLRLQIADWADVGHLADAQDETVAA